MEWEPAFRTQVVIVDPTDSANGYATTLPNNTIVIYAAQPSAESSLDNYEHWLWSIFVHEYAHILQIDKVSGVPKVLRQIIGRMVTPGAVLPGWMTEGFATYIETRFTAGGRGRSTFTDMLLRSAALAGKLPPIDTASGHGHRWPRGQLRYLYGARFHFEVERQAGRGDRSWVDFHRRHARGIIPFILPAKASFGATFSAMWKTWQSDLYAGYLSEAERVSAEGSGLTTTRVIPTLQGIASSPRYTPDGQSISYSHSSPHKQGSLRSVRRDGSEERLLWKGEAAQSEWSPDGGLLYFTALGPASRYTRYRDLFQWNPETKKRKRLSRGARLADPTVHPSGDWLVGVQAWRGQSQLVRVDLPSESAPTITVLTNSADGSQYAQPTWAPSGEIFAASVWKPGGFRDIHVFDADGKHLRALSWDRASDTDPVFSPDGDWIVFASDRDGIWNLFAYRWEDGSFFRVTRLLGGARQPDISPDGAHIVFKSYTAEGWQLEEIPWRPSQLERYRIPGRALPGPEQGPSAAAIAPSSPLEGVPGPVMPHGSGPAEAVTRARSRSDFKTLAENPEPTPAQARPPGPRDDVSGIPSSLGKVKKYNPLRTLFPPRYLTVFGSLTDSGALGGIGTGGQDALSQHAWSASIHYRTDSRFFGGSGGYTLNAFHPRLSVVYSSIALDYGNILLRNGRPPVPGGTQLAGVFRGQQHYFERRDRLSLGVSVPIKLRHTLSARYKLEFRRPLRDLPDDADPAYLPARGSFSGLVFGWSWGSFKKRPAGISPEESWLISLSVDVESSYLGAYRIEPDGDRLDLHRAILTGEARRYIALPWAKGHVLALRAVGGATFGTDIPQRTFRMGGAYGDNPYVSLPDRYYGLRGYRTSGVRGNHMFLATAEYRLPLALIERGAWTVPVWLRSIALTVFVEAGQAWDSEDYSEFGGSEEGFVSFWENTRPAAGVELVGDMLIGWGAYLQGRVGYAVGTGSGAIPSGTFYAQVGSSF